MPPIYLPASSSLLPRFIFGPQDPGFEFRSQLHGNKLVKLRRGDELKKTRSQTNSQIKRKLSSPSSQPKLLQYWFPWKLGWSTFLYIWNWCNSWYSYGWKWTHLGIPIPEFHRFRNGLEYIPKGLPMGLMRYHTSYISRFLVFWMFVKWWKKEEATSVWTSAAGCQLDGATSSATDSPGFSSIVRLNFGGDRVPGVDWAAATESWGGRWQRRGRPRWGAEETAAHLKILQTPTYNDSKAACTFVFKI